MINFSKTKFATLLFATVFTVLSGNAVASASSCKSDLKAVQFKAITDELLIAKGNRSDVETISHQSGAFAARKTHGHLAGLYKADISMKRHDVKANIVQTFSGFCVKIEKINIELALKNPLIYLPKDIDIKTCSGQVTLRHELTHDAIDRKWAREFEKKANIALQDFIDDFSKYRFNSKPEAAQAFAKEIRYQMNSLYYGYSKERTRRQHAIDTHDAYHKDQEARKNCKA